MPDEITFAHVSGGLLAPSLIAALRKETAKGGVADPATFARNGYEPSASGWTRMTLRYTEEERAAFLREHRDLAYASQQQVEWELDIDDARIALELEA